jgi:hypothetical protein
MAPKHHLLSTGSQVENNCETLRSRPPVSTPDDPVFRSRGVAEDFMPAGDFASLRTLVVLAGLACLSRHAPPGVEVPGMTSRLCTIGRRNLAAIGLIMPRWSTRRPATRRVWPSRGIVTSPSPGCTSMTRSRRKLSARMPRSIKYFCSDNVGTRTAQRMDKDGGHWYLDTTFATGQLRGDQDGVGGEYKMGRKGRQSTLLVGTSRGQHRRI